MLSINEISLEDFQAMQTEEEKIKFYDLICEKSNRIKKGTAYKTGIRKIKPRQPVRLFKHQENGRLYPVGELQRRDKNNGVFYILSICDCGNWVISSTPDFKNEHSCSCGCKSNDRLIQYNKENKYLDLIGQTFGQLLVIEKTDMKDSCNNLKWKCKCIDCGYEQIVSGHAIKKGDRFFCERCSPRKSIGEHTIRTLLEEKNMTFEIEKQFDTCRFKKTNWKARFDFYVENKYCIEFDGEDHFTIGRRGSISKEEGILKLKERQEKDVYKNQWCKENNIPLIRIPYTHLKQLCIEDLLLETTTFLVNSEEASSF